MKTSDWLRHIPWTILFCAAALLLCGLSAIQRGDELYGRSPLLGRQTVWSVVSAVVMIAATCFPYRRLKWFSYHLFLLAVVLLVVVYFMPARNNARRWIPLGWLSFQPSELAKLAYILALAHYLMYRKNYRRLTGLLVPFLLTLVPVGLILREPNLGTSLLFMPVLFGMLFAAGARPRHLVCIALLGAVCSPLLWMGMSAEQRSRVVTVFRQQDSGPSPKGDGYHLHQSKRVLALGSVWGSELAGTVTDDPLIYHLPEARTDFVFCLMGERWGLVGCVMTLSVYVVLFARGLSIAGATHDPFGRLLAVGIVALLASQVVINTGMTVGLMPITGLTLPMMSYGGSSLLTTAVALGLLMNVGMRPGYEVTGEPFRFSHDE